MKAVHIIANPVAGGGRGARLAAALAVALEGRGLAVTQFATVRSGDAQAEAARSMAPVVAVVGGDGTLNEVLNGLPARSDTRLAMLPAGTANVVARELGMHSDAVFVAEAIVRGAAIPMDIGLHGDRRFLLGAGAGVDAAITKAVQAQRGRKSSLFQWVGPALKTLARYRYPKIAVVVDGEELAATADYVIVGNCRYSAGIFPATPQAEIADGKLDVCALSGLSLPRLAWLLANVWRPTFIDRPWIAYRQGQEVELRAHGVAESIDLQIDGDPAGTLPAHFTIADWQVQMIVP